MLTAILLFVSVVLVGLTAGGLAFMGFAVATATPKLSSGTFVRVHQALYRKADPLMPIVVCASLIATVPLGVAMVVQDTTVSPAWVALVALGFVIVIVITRIGNKPINKIIARWDATSPPADWAAERDRFNRFHAWRTVAALVSFVVVVVVGVVVTEPAVIGPSWLGLSVLVSGLNAGGLAFMYAVVGRATLTVGGSTYVEAHQRIALMATRYMTGITLLTVLMSAGYLFILWPTGPLWAVVHAGLAVLAALTVIVVSVGFSVPMNRRIARWDAADPPVEWDQVRDRWMRVHTVRTTAAVVAFLLLASCLLTVS
ncbi:anthrone oxygenase family protein [Nakamurella sp.]|uniref:anthrone oxygenase family protein n=1 Tax=Nakamurella sp. TaxID=1869182 RepID=UPI0037852DA5